MAPNLTSTPTLFLAEAAVCPPSSVISPSGPRQRPSVAPKAPGPVSTILALTPAPASPAPAPVAPTTTPAPATPTSATSASPAIPSTDLNYEWKIVWRNVIAFIYLHVGTLYGLYLTFTGQCMGLTALWTFVSAALGALGITAGAHRLWAHRSYKAKWPMRLMLMAFQTMAFQNHIYEWVRDHRVHHKFTDTDADPHNASRGFFFSHMGWLMVRKHPDVRRKGKGVDMSDLEQDGIVMWQKKWYAIAMPLMCFVFPAWVPVRFWGEDPWVAWYCSSVLRYTLSLHGTWLVNSAAHIWGTRPIDKTISPTENTFVGYLAFGEGWHNYHHVFPWDYKAAELGDYAPNITLMFINSCAKLGWAYDLKTVSKEMIEKRVRRTGDGTHRYASGKAGYGLKEEDTRHHHNHDGEVWGWGDHDMAEEDILDATILNKAE